jgi:Rrf2 family protein
MKVSAQEEYGLRCLMQMARNGAEASLSIPEISRAEGLSAPNVAKLMRVLRLGGLVSSVRGQEGGYVLARPPESITLDQVLEVLGEPLFGTRFCEQHTGAERTCAHRRDCSMRPVWISIQRRVNDVLARTSLRDLLRDEEEVAEWVSRFESNGSRGNRNTLTGTAHNS